MKTLEQRVAVLEAQILPKTKAISADDQRLLDDGWIRHTGDVCPVHELDEVKVMMLANQAILKSAANELYWGKDFPLKITHYKVIKEYVEPTTFEMKVGYKVFVLNKPYMSAPESGARYFSVNMHGAIFNNKWVGDSFDYGRLLSFNCWRTEADAKAYAEAKLARDKLEIGEIK
jgi:hypothetical protein